jgi:hypothetical protein
MTRPIGLIGILAEPGYHQTRSKNAVSKAREELGNPEITSAHFSCLNRNYESIKVFTACTNIHFNTIWDANVAPLTA